MRERRRVAEDGAVSQVAFTSGTPESSAVPAASVLSATLGVGLWLSCIPQSSETTSRAWLNAASVKNADAYRTISWPCSDCPFSREQDPKPRPTW